MITKEGYIMAEAKWYIVQTTPMYEKQVMGNILRLKESRFPDNIVDCKIITETVQKESTNRKGEPIVKDVEEKLYPCYVFIKMIYDDRLVAAVRWMTGVSRWVGIEYTPIPLTPSEVGQMIGLEEVDSDITVGANCIINEGPLEGFEAVVIAIKGQEAILSVDMFGRETEAEVSLNKLKLVTED